ncbi:hypothetical protein [Methylobacterium isbiliense]|jgi:hypothetical protein|uniref:Uncharacterized protein n=1 Tax=Methylobacterium isbiliense TaxID=315478 RepID=A0ABQ4SA20_9HYPH|nr:hypothetical protein [Methylobacterium isbiliense]MDN3625549.1 hypothetical protein [Methylobacterium isbiliense]GJD98643.1 hypothetical protein GMJLKIPL_0554 [Methylobacterium isbiliense]
MAKTSITGTARSPSDEEFRQRVARLAPLPTVEVPAAKRRPAKTKAAPAPERPSDASGPDESPDTD